LAEINPSRGRRRRDANPPSACFPPRYSYCPVVHDNLNPDTGSQKNRGGKAMTSETPYKNTSDKQTDSRLRSQSWFDDRSNPDMTALYIERYLNYGLIPFPRDCFDHESCIRADFGQL